MVGSLLSLLFSLPFPVSLSLFSLSLSLSLTLTLTLTMSLSLSLTHYLSILHSLSRSSLSFSVPFLSISLSHSLSLSFSISLSSLTLSPCSQKSFSISWLERGQLYLTSQAFTFFNVDPNLAALENSNSGDSMSTSFLVRNWGTMSRSVFFIVRLGKVRLG